MLVEKVNILKNPQLKNLSNPFSLNLILIHFKVTKITSQSKILKYLGGPYSPPTVSSDWVTL